MFFQPPSFYEFDETERKPPRLRELKVISRLVNSIFALAILGTATYAASTARDFVAIRDNLAHHMATVVRKGEVLARLRSTVGYGGFIHDFKNYVLRQEDYRPAQLEEELKLFREMVAEYRRLDLSPAETGALDAIERTFDTYEGMIAIAREYAAQGRAPAETDTRVKVDDTEAIQGFDTLHTAWLEGRERYSRGLAAGVEKSLDELQIALFGIPLFILVGIGLVWFQRKLAREIRAYSEVSDRLGTVDALNRAVMDSVNYAIIGADAEGRVTVFNRAAQQLTGHDPKAVMGRDAPSTFLEPRQLADTAARVSAELGREVPPTIELFHLMLAESGIHAGEWTFLRTDGSTVPVFLSISMLRSGDEITGFVGIAYDIAERKKLENMQREFVSTVSHELRTPLTSISGSLSLVQAGVAGEISDKARNLVDIAHQNSQRLLMLVNDLLDIERLQADHMTFHFRDYRLDGLISASAAANAAYAAARQVRIEIAETAGGNVTVRADQDRFLQVMANLLSNAAKFSPDGGAVQIRARTDGGGMAEVSVIDHGPGVPARHRERVFDRFWQADSSDTRAKQGSGLGLSIAKGIVEHHGGEVRISETPGGGATFTFTLPLAETAGRTTDTPGRE